MADKTNIAIKYTDRDFSSIKSALVEHAKRYYPETYKNFNEASFGSLVFDSVAYVGDVLSFYVDYASNEAHLKTAVEYDNVLKHGYRAGFKYNPFATSTGLLSLYCLVPANGGAPDLRYAPVVKKGSIFSSPSLNFTLIENVNMANPNFETRVARRNESTGAPTHFAIKGFGQIISGEVRKINVPVGAFQKFLKIELQDSNISEIVSVTDREGNSYYEVDYLSQNVIYKEVPNLLQDSLATPSLLVPYASPRRFIVERYQNKTYMIFGSTDSYNIENDITIEEPSKVILEIDGKGHITDTTFDPNRLANSDKFGISPSNTELLITYRVNTTQNSNAAANSITQISSIAYEILQESILDSVKISETKASFSVNNDEPIVGSVTTPDIDELKIRILNNQSAQNRCVTVSDYENYCYSMPSKFGSIKRVKAVNDPGAFKRNLNLYIISEDNRGKLIKSTTALKSNLKTWLEKNKMISDTIDILDASIINLSIDFIAIGAPGYSKSDVLAAGLAAIKKNYLRLPAIGEPIVINDILATLKSVPSILDVTELNIRTKTGPGYSNLSMSINFSTSDLGAPRVVNVPLNVVWEVKNPDSDITGIIL